MIFRMRRKPHADRIQPACRHRRDPLRPRQNDRQRPRPEGLGEPQRRFLGFRIEQMLRRVGVEADVVLDGGTLHIKHEENGPVLMTGPAAEVFRGVI